MPRARRRGLDFVADRLAAAPVSRPRSASPAPAACSKRAPGPSRRRTRCARRRCRAPRALAAEALAVTRATTSNLTSSGQSTRSSGVVSVFGTSASSRGERLLAPARRSRAGAATRRSRRRSRSSGRRRTGARSSRRRGARCSSFIFVLISEWPVFHTIGRAAVPRDVVVQRLRALHLAEDRRARVLGAGSRARTGSSACRPR